MRRLLESLWSFCHYLGQADRWHRPASGDSSANRSHQYDGMGTLHSIPPVHEAHTDPHVKQINCRSTELLGLNLSFECVAVWMLLADGTSGSELRGYKESARAKTGQIVLLHKPRTNEGENGARRCYVIKFRSGGRS